ncbi:unnamed protein product, partial [Trichogramma brassicae]
MKFMLIGSLSFVTSLRPVLPAGLNIGGEIVPFSEEIKTPDVYLSGKFNWDRQIALMTSKVHHSLYTLRFYKHSLSRKMRVMLVGALVSPHLNYPAPLLTDLTKKQSLALQRLQNACIRFIYGTIPRTAHITPYRLALGWLSAEGRREVINCSLASRIIRDVSPGYLRGGFRVIRVPTEIEEIRQSARRRPPVLYEFAFSSAIAINKLPFITNILSLPPCFKSLHTSFLMQHEKAEWLQRRRMEGLASVPSEQPTAQAYRRRSWSRYGSDVSDRPWKKVRREEDTGALLHVDGMSNNEAKGAGRGYVGKTDPTRKSARIQGVPGQSFEDSATFLEQAKFLKPGQKPDEESPYQSFNEDSDSFEETIVEQSTQTTVENTANQNIINDSPASYMSQNKCDLPRFWRSAPKAWFVQAECLFAAKNVTEDDKKFNLLVGALDQETAVELMDVIDPPPAENTKYKTVKDAIVHRTTDSTEKQLHTCHWLSSAQIFLHVTDCYPTARTKRSSTCSPVSEPKDPFESHLYTRSRRWKQQRKIPSLNNMLVSSTNFSDLFEPSAGPVQIKSLPVKHNIITTGPTISERPRRLTGDRLAAAKKVFDDLLNQGIIRPSNSQWASPLHLVPKKNGSWRVTGDYRRLNAVTVPDRYPLPIIEDLLQESPGK